MSTSAPRSDRRSLQQSLDWLVRSANGFLSRWHLQRDLRQAAGNALMWLFVGPALLLLVELLALLFGKSAFAFSIWTYIVLALAGPVLYIAGKVIWQHLQRRIERHSGLGLFDRQLDSKERLVTADEFLAVDEQAENEQTRSFMRAAVDDAHAYVQSALQARLDSLPLPEWHVRRMSWVGVPAALVAVLLGLWIAGLQGIGSTQDEKVRLASADINSMAAKDEQDRVGAPRVTPRAPRREDARELDPAQKESQESSRFSPRLSRNKEEAEGQSKSGQQSNTRSSSQSSSASGRPSDQQTPSQEKKEEEIPPDEENDKPEPEKKDQQKKPPSQQASSTASSGEGKSKSSSSDAVNIAAEERPDPSAARKKKSGEEEGMQDEDEEEKNNSVERPTLRKKKPPVDRNASPVPTGDGPSLLANGRSGPGGIKKTRGVPAMILGVPVPDRLQGMKNPGRSKVTQENSNPKEEAQVSLLAQQRLTRQDAFGRIQHPLMLPWMQSLVEHYFINLRAARDAAAGIESVEPETEEESATETATEEEGESNE